MKSFILIFFLFANSAYAKDVLHLWLNSLSSINGSMTRNSCQNSSSAATQHQQLFQECALALCGRPKDVGSGIILDFNFDQFVEPENEAKFDELIPKIKEVYELEAKNLKEFVKAYKESAKNKTNINFSEWDEYDFENFSYRVYDRHLIEDIDYSRPVDQRISYTVDLPSDASDILKAGLADYLEQKKKSIRESFTNMLYSNIYKLDEAKDELRKIWIKLNNDIEKARSENANIFVDQENQLLDIKVKLENLDSIKEIYPLAEIANQINILDGELYFRSTGEWRQREYTRKCKNEACQLGVKEYINKLDLGDFLTTFNKAIDNVDQKIKEMTSYCKSEYISKTLKAWDKDEIKKLLPEIKEQFLENVFKGLSSHSRDEFEDYMNNRLHMVFNRRMEEPQKLIDLLNENYNSYFEMTKYDPDYSVASKKELDIKLLDSFDDFINEVNPYKNIHLCQDQSSATIWDAFAPKKF